MRLLGGERKGFLIGGAPVEKGDQSRSNRQDAHRLARFLGVGECRGKGVQMNAVRIDKITAIRSSQVTHDPFGHLGQRGVRLGLRIRNQAQDPKRTFFGQHALRKVGQRRGAV